MQCIHPMSGMRAITQGEQGEETTMKAMWIVEFREHLGGAFVFERVNVIASSVSEAAAKAAKRKMIAKHVITKIELLGVED